VRHRRGDRGRPGRLLRPQAAQCTPRPVQHEHRARSGHGDPDAWGFEGYLEEYEQIASKLASGEIDEEQHSRARAELGERYGVVWHDERIPEARARSGIGP
jgi:hypothetical protein